MLLVRDDGKFVMQFLQFQVFIPFNKYVYDKTFPRIHMNTFYLVFTQYSVIGMVELCIVLKTEPIRIQCIF